MVRGLFFDELLELMLEVLPVLQAAEMMEYLMIDHIVCGRDVQCMEGSILFLDMLALKLEQVVSELYPVWTYIVA